MLGGVDPDRARDLDPEIALDLLDRALVAPGGVFVAWKDGAIAGFANLPEHFWFGIDFGSLALKFEHYVEPVGAFFPGKEQGFTHAEFNGTLALVATAAGLLGIGLTAAFYTGKLPFLVGLTSRSKVARFFKRILENKYGMDDLWIGGTDLYHYSGGGAFDPAFVPSQVSRITAMWAVSPDDVWIAGATELLHFNGTAWDWESGVKMPIYGLGGLSGGDLWAVGAAGSLSHYQGNVWRAVETGTTVNLRSLAVSSHGDMWIVGEQGAVLRGSPGKLLPLQSGTVGNLYNVAAPDPQTAWLVGASGVLTYRR